MPKEQIEEPGLDPKEKVRRLIENLGPIQNTIQYSWLVEMCQTFFGLHDERGHAAELGGGVRRGRDADVAQPIGRSRC